LLNLFTFWVGLVAQIEDRVLPDALGAGQAWDAGQSGEQRCRVHDASPSDFNRR
jgi:hypothetical protein